MRRWMTCAARAVSASSTPPAVATPSAVAIPPAIANPLAATTQRFIQKVTLQLALSFVLSIVG